MIRRTLLCKTVCRSIGASSYEREIMNKEGESPTPYIQAEIMNAKISRCTLDGINETLSSREDSPKEMSKLGDNRKFPKTRF